MTNILYVSFGVLLTILLILAGMFIRKLFYLVCDLMERMENRKEEKQLNRLMKKAHSIVYATSFRETFRRGKLEVNNLALLLDEVKELDPTLYDDLVLRLSKAIRKEEVKQGLVKATELVDLPSHFGDDTDDDEDLIVLEKDL
ncbi:hypothetical protein EC55P2_00051 [Enterococcus phage EC55P2]|nr:hypothetical protein EC55P2_00051 [Enterococcus phage EC55P2]